MTTPEPATAALRWAEAGVAPPPPSRREPRPDRQGVEDDGVWLLSEHLALAAAVTARSPADFRPLPALVNERGDALRLAFDEREVLPPSLVSELAHLLSPRLERLEHGLRRRLARTRELLPLQRVRELDPGCLRRNARLPGRTLLEKAGPSQQLVAVRRVARFDTTENRMLVATCRRLRHRAAAELARIPLDSSGRRVRALRLLSRRVDAVLARPELDGVGAPRPGERPSNAMLGDADYRAMWRAWQLLCAEEERFVERWSILHTLWSDLVELAVWAALDRLSDLDAVPTWLRLDGTLRVGGSRRWIRLGEDSAEEITVRRTEDHVTIGLRRFDPDGQVTEVARVLPTVLTVSEWRLAVQGADRADRHGAATLALAVTELLGQTGERRAASERGEQAGLCALEATLCVSDEHGLRVVDAAAAAVVDGPDGEPMPVLGRAATWVPGLAGPEALHREHAERAGQLVARWSGLRETAVVVPEAMDELALGRLRRSAGPVWAVWSPVAAALAAAEDPEGPFSNVAERLTVLVVVHTDAALDVATLEVEPREWDGRPDRLWIRSAPPPGRLPGREEARRLDEATRAAWLRAPATETLWREEAGTLTRVAAPGSPPSIAADVERKASGWRGTAPTAMILCGLDPVDERDLRARWPDRVVVSLPARRLAEGASVFLRRRREGRPTWKDRLPALEVLAIIGRLEKGVPIVPPGKLVAPGDPIAFTSNDDFVLPSSVPSVSFAMQREGAPAGFVLRLDGAPLPLPEPVRVKIRVRYRHGLQGIEGELVPVGRVPFDRLPFRFEADGEVLVAAPAGVPPEPILPSVSDDARSRIAGATRDLERAFSRLSPRDLKKDPGRAKALESEVRGLHKVLNEIRSVSGAALTGSLRALLEQETAPLLDAILGLSRRRAPDLARSTRDQVLRARGSAHVRGDGLFAAHVLGVGDLDASTRLSLLGSVVDGRDDAIWEALVVFSTARPHDHGAWAHAVADALEADLGLARRLGPRADRLVVRAVEQVEDIARAREVSRYRQALFYQVQVIPWLCHARASGGLGPETAEHAVARVAAVRDALPEDVRAFGEASVLGQNREPIRLALAWLAGDYSTPPKVEPA